MVRGQNYKAQTQEYYKTPLNNAKREMSDVMANKLRASVSFCFNL
jgi:hypothetical protein